MKKYYLFKKLISIFLSLFIFSFPCMYTCANKQRPVVNHPLPKNISIYGGPFSAIKSQSYDHQKFEVHHLLSRSALNMFAKFVFDTYGESLQNEFLKSSKQGWAPSILLTTEDHLKTLSKSKPGCNLNLLYISEQAFQTIQYGAFLEMLKNEISYIQKYINVDGKYDEGIRQVCNYIKSMNIRIHKNKLSFYPLGTENSSLKFTYIIPKHNILSVPIFSEPYLSEDCTSVDMSVQTDSPTISTSCLAEKSVQTDAISAESNNYSSDETVQAEVVSSNFFQTPEDMTYHDSSDIAPLTEPGKAAYPSSINEASSENVLSCNLETSFSQPKLDDLENQPNLSDGL